MPNKRVISKKSIELLQFRIKEEEQSSRLYLAMSLWLKNEGYVNAGKLWKEYSDEEMEHAEWAREYLLSFGVLPDTPELKKVSGKYKGFPDIIKQSFQHEIKITLQIQKFGEHAKKIKDNMLYTLVQKYLKEQVDEHDKLQNLLDHLKSFGTNKSAMKLLDNSLKKSE